MMLLLSMLWACAPHDTPTPPVPAELGVSDTADDSDEALGEPVAASLSDTADGDE